MEDQYNMPKLGDAMEPHQESDAARRLLSLRRSTPADFLTEPGPNASVLQDMLTMAARVPDHRRVTPFRFVVFDNDDRARAGAIICNAFLKNEPDADPSRVNYERSRFLRAPVVVAVISSVDKSHRTPEWEQVLSAGAVCQTLLLAASAHGFAAQWLTEWYAYDAMVTNGLGLTEVERIAGFIYVGTASEPPKERARPQMTEIVSNFSAITTT